MDLTHRLLWRLVFWHRICSVCIKQAIIPLIKAKWCNLISFSVLLGHFLTLLEWFPPFLPSWVLWLLNDEKLFVTWHRKERSRSTQRKKRDYVIWGVRRISKTWMTRQNCCFRCYCFGLSPWSVHHLSCYQGFIWMLVPHVCRSSYSRR